MSITKKIIITVTAGLALGTSSCRKFLNVNTNPNQATTATLATLLPAGQLLTGSALGTEMQITGSIWGEYWTQNPNSSQYRSLEQYQPGQDVFFSSPWTNLYSANENYYQLGKLADTMKNKQYKAIALLMEAYTFQLITDGWGDAPFKQALLGQPSDGGILNPKYDSQSVIYRGIIGYIDSAMALLDNNDPVKPGKDDLIYGGDMDKWGRFGNTLKLKIYLRMSEVNPTAAQAGVAALYAAGATFMAAGDDAIISYGSSSANKNPLYAEGTSTQLNGTQNLVASNTCVDSMIADNDHRRFVFYEATGNDVTGIAQGDYGSTATTISIPGTYVGGDFSSLNRDNSASAPVNFFTSYESLFLQAEAVARTWGSGSDQTLFESGITASFGYYTTGITEQSPDYADGAEAAAAYIGTAYWGTYPATGTVAEKLRHIITQKWFSMCGNQGFEAWTEHRRTGYPDFFVLSPHAVTSSLPVRFLYPTSESTRNSNFPGLKQVTEKVWWDIF